MNLWQQWRARLHHGVRPDIEVNAYLRQLMANLLAMAWFVEARDPYTGGHLWRVSRYARLLAEEPGLPVAEVRPGYRCDTRFLETGLSAVSHGQYPAHYSCGWHVVECSEPGQCAMVRHKHAMRTNLAQPLCTHCMTTMTTYSATKNQLNQRSDE